MKKCIYCGKKAFKGLSTSNCKSGPRRCAYENEPKVAKAPEAKNLTPAT